MYQIRESIRVWNGTLDQATHHVERGKRLFSFFKDIGFSNSVLKSGFDWSLLFPDGTQFVVDQVKAMIQCNRSLHLKLSKKINGI